MQKRSVGSVTRDKCWMGLRLAGELVNRAELRQKVATPPTRLSNSLSKSLSSNYQQPGAQGGCLHEGTFAFHRYAKAAAFQLWLLQIMEHFLQRFMWIPFRGSLMHHTDI